jgi:hypothetical protein
MAVNEKQTLRRTWGWLFALPALAGLGSCLSFWGMFAVVRFADIGVSEGVFWAWVIVGWLGMAGALVFGSAAVIASRPAGPTATKARRIGLGLLATTRNRIQARMLERLEGVIDRKYLTPRHFSRLHSILLNYLLLHQGNPVSAARIRVLTGEQIHTERRVRELRDFGFEVKSSSVSGEQTYALESSESDIDGAAYELARRNIIGDRSLALASRHLLVAELDSATKNR